MKASQNSRSEKKTTRPAPLPSDLKAAAPFLQGAKEIEQIQSPDLAKLYERRAGRLEALAAKAAEDGGDYPDFLRKMVLAQKEILTRTPLKEKEISEINHWVAAPELPKKDVFEKAVFLQKTYANLLEKIAKFLPEKTFAELEKLSEDAKAFAHQTWHLLNGQFAECLPEAILPIWAALSLCYAQAAQIHAENIKKDKNTIPSHAHCPYCGTPPMGGMVMTGAQEGLRYEQCALCETRWHKVRSICPECLGSEHIDYWSIDDKMAAIEIESCGDCHSYSKILRLDRDPNLELCSDDLASLSLDYLIEEKGFAKRTFNPLAPPIPK